MRILLLVLVAVLVGPSNPPARAETIPVLKGGRPQLFLDDRHLTEATSGLALELGSVEKHAANPILGVDRPWERGGLSYLCAYRDDEEKRYKLWYETGPEGQGALAFATSTDGIRWEKPSLGLVTFEGSRDNNLVFAPPAPPRKHKVFWVVKDYAEPDPGKRYKMLYHLWDFRGRGLGVAHSPDGLRWTAPPYTVLRGTFDTHNVMFWDDAIGRFVGYFRWTYFGVRNIARATSPDGFHWSEPEWVHGPDGADGPRRDLYTPGIYKYGAAERVYVMLTSAWDARPADTFTVQLGLSRDGIAWRRFRKAFIPHGPPGSWDSGSLIVSPSEIEVGGRTAFYYLGSVKAHDIPDRSRIGVGLGFMRVDAFAGYRAAATGVLTTRMLRIGRGATADRGDRSRGLLCLNLELAGGRARAALLDPAGVPYLGFSLAESKPVTISGRAQPVAWAGHPDLGPVLGKPVKLRIEITRGTLYGFTVKDR